MLRPATGGVREKVSLVSVHRAIEIASTHIDEERAGGGEVWDGKVVRRN